MYYSIVLVALLNVKVSSAVQGQRSEPVHRLDVHFYRSRDHATEADAWRDTAAECLPRGRWWGCQRSLEPITGLPASQTASESVWRSRIIRPQDLFRRKVVIFEFFIPQLS